MPSDAPRFTLTLAHLKLLRQANIQWIDLEWGAPGIDPKRPYGNSDCEMSIAEILGWPLVVTRAGADITPEQSAKAQELHKQMKDALAVFLRCATMLPGDFAASAYSQDWKEAKL